MKIKEVDCSLFRPEKCDDGKIRCRFFMQDGFCELPQMFDCIMAKKREKTVHSYSSISTYLSCKRKYHLQYHLGIYPKKVPDWAIRGRVFHAMLAEYYLTGSKPQINYKDTPTMVGSTMALAHCEFYNKDRRDGQDVERKIETESLLSYIDLLESDTITDHKLSAEQPSFLDIAFQGSFYIKNLSLIDIQIEKLIINFVKTPALRLKGSESLEEFSERILKDVRENPLKYFDRKTYLRNEFEPYIPMIDQLVEEIGSIKKDGIHFYMNPGGCKGMFGSRCDYEPVCLTGQVDKTLFNVAKKPKEARDERGS